MGLTTPLPLINRPLHAYDWRTSSHPVATLARRQILAS